MSEKVRKLRRNVQIAEMELSASVKIRKTENSHRNRCVTRGKIIR